MRRENVPLRLSAQILLPCSFDLSDTSLRDGSSRAIGSIYDPFSHMEAHLEYLEAIDAE